MSGYWHASIAETPEGGIHVDLHVPAVLDVCTATSSRRRARHWVAAWLGMPQLEDPKAWEQPNPKHAYWRAEGSDE